VTSDRKVSEYQDILEQLEQVARKFRREPTDKEELKRLTQTLVSMKKDVPVENLHEIVLKLFDICFKLAFSMEKNLAKIVTPAYNEFRELAEKEGIL